MKSIRKEVSMSKSADSEDIRQSLLDYAQAAISKGQEAVAVELASDSSDDDLVAELDTTAYELGELINNLRQINKEATVQEYIRGEI